MEDCKWVNGSEEFAMRKAMTKKVMEVVWELQHTMLGTELEECANDYGDLERVVEGVKELFDVALDDMRRVLRGLCDEEADPQGEEQLLAEEDELIRKGLMGKTVRWLEIYKDRFISHNVRDIVGVRWNETEGCHCVKGKNGEFLFQGRVVLQRLLQRGVWIGKRPSRTGMVVNVLCLYDGDSVEAKA